MISAFAGKVTCIDDHVCLSLSCEQPAINLNLKGMLMISYRGRDSLGSPSEGVSDMMTILLFFSAGTNHNPGSEGRQRKVISAA